MHFSKRYRYRFGDIDDAGIAYYPALMHYFHCAFEDWWADALGTSYPKLMHDEKLGFPAVRLEAEFFKPVRYGHEPWIHTGVLDMGSTSVQFGFWMSTDEAGRDVHCWARVTTVAVDMDRLAKVDQLARSWRAAFENYRLEAGEFPSRDLKDRGK